MSNKYSETINCPECRWMACIVEVAQKTQERFFDRPQYYEIMQCTQCGFESTECKNCEVSSCH